MLTKLDIQGPRTSVLSLPISGDEVPDSSLQILNIDGLGPVKADVNTMSFAEIDGAAYLGTPLVGGRNIVITFGLNPDWADQTVAGLRRMLYEYFMPKLPVTLAFESLHMPKCGISGTVESVEPNIFSKDPEVQVSVICPDPDLVSVVATTTTGVVGFSGSDTQVIEYAGTVPSGILLKVRSSTARPTFAGVLTVVNTQLVAQTFTATATINSTQRYELSSHRGSRYVRSVNNSSSAITNLLRTTPNTIVWPELIYGDNTIGVFAPSSGTAGQAWELSYFERFGGI